ncbi:MAG: methionine synthase [Spirochaetes bacterium GWF1_31_7]|nr:MAG: methionine synthase [Spirochaetes bacterium GWE1_32_154]OHD50763.1 MAG: methionine synthase [Spirochaetes bacterium GWF1_31_7]HBD95103.1 methionine synthase [Spirochaetia bacterium]HBI38011.1 methionine synthase [Spirochaetia bacterium]
MVNKKTILSLLTEKILILDGAMGTMIQKEKLTEEDFRGNTYKNHTINLKGNNDILNITKPDLIQKIHLLYLEAGADIIETNTFNSTTISQSDYKNDTAAYQLNVAGAQIAKKATAEYYAKTGKQTYVAGILGPTSRTLSMSPDVNNPAFRNISFVELSDSYFTALEGLIDGGADLIMIETVFDTLNCKAAIYAIKKYEEQHSIEIPLMISGTITDASGRTLSGQTPLAFYYSIMHAEAISVGFNCALGAADMEKHLYEITNAASCNISTHPNAGLPNELGEYDDSPENMARVLHSIASHGLLNIAGGCCGTTPSHIKAIKEALENVRPRLIPDKQHYTVMTGLEPLIIQPDSLFVNIGERTNVSGSKKFANLIKNEQYEEAVDIAKNQVDNGAQMIDINMDEALIDGQKAMETYLSIISTEPEIARVPFMIDSSNFNILIKGLQSTQGRCAVNSISLKEGETIFINHAREIKKYGACVVIMAFDENGQATGCDEKVAILTRAINLLIQEAGYDEEDIIFDPNIFAVGTGIAEHDRYGLDFFEATIRLKKLFPNAQISGGVSNISFSFKGNNPLREAIHTVFLYHAIQKGLSMGIVNPGQIGIYDDIETSLRLTVEDLLFARDPESNEKLIAMANNINSTSNADIKNLQWREGDFSEKISYSLMKGIDTFIETDAEEARLYFKSAVQVIEISLMNGMRLIGELFGAGKMFLPQVVKSARVMKKAVHYLTPFITEEQRISGETAVKPKIVLATVKGDVHDIGKNIVGIVLACNNYEIIDLGVMVSADVILQKAKEIHADIIGLSGLITPSLEEMSHVASEMEKSGFTIPLLIGGATTSKLHTALKIDTNYSGPVVYVEDASQAVGVAGNLLDKNATGFAAAIKADYQTIRENRMKANIRVELIPLEEARKHRFTFPDSYQPDIPNKTGIIPLHDYPISDVEDFIDWQFFFREWNIKGRLETILTDPDSKEEAQKLVSDAKKMLSMLKKEKNIQLNAVFGIFPAHSAGDTVLIYDDKNSVKATVNFLRQQTISENKQHYLCLSDYILPQESGKKDYMGFFAVTAGIGVDVLAKKFQDNNDDYSALMIKIIANRLAEAFTEKLHLMIRKEYWGYAPDENLSKEEILGMKYRGIRPAPGYPPCPEHSEKAVLFDLLNAETATGIKLSESWMMIPEASVCGYVFAAPESKYFVAGKIGEDQISDYAKRKGFTPEKTKIALGL